MIVVDCAAAVDALTTAPETDELRAYLAVEELHAPSLLDFEIVSVLRGLTLSRQLSPTSAQDALTDLDDLPIERWPPADPLRRRAFQLRNNVSAYDAAYVALAESLDCPLLTRDARLARSGGHQARIEVRLGVDTATARTAAGSTVSAGPRSPSGSAEPWPRTATHSRDSEARLTLPRPHDSSPDLPCYVSCRVHAKTLRAHSPYATGVRTLVLWDVDHTLVDIGGLSGEIYAAVFARVTGQPLRQLANMAGRTDRAIMSETLRLHSVAPEEPLLGEFADALADAFADAGEEIRRRGRVLPGAAAAVLRLSERADVVQSVLTGNMRAIAAGKLTAFGLDSHIDLAVGAYGMDTSERRFLVGLAQRRAEEKYGQVFNASSTVLVGDTPNDVDAGHRGGARVVAVATGASDEQELRRAGAETVLADLSNTGDFVRAALEVTVL